MSLTLFSSPGCHLCEQAEDIVDYVGVPFEVVDITSDVELVRLYGIRIPVLKRSDGAELGWRRPGMARGPHPRRRRGHLRQHVSTLHRRSRRLLV